MNQPGRPVPFISRVRLRNYKSIAECDVHLGPLTILIGPNGTGKSNFLDALALVGAALDTNLSTAIQDRGGMLGILRVVPQRADSFSIDVDIAVPWRSATGEWAVGSYGFEIGAAQGSGLGGPPWVIRETCEMRWGGQTGAYHREQGTVFDGSNTHIAEMESDRLYLPLAGSQLPVGGFQPGNPTASIPTAFTALLRGLAAMRFYNFALGELRRPQPEAVGSALGHQGEHLADILGALDEHYKPYKERLDAYLRAVVPDVAGIDRWFVGGNVAPRYVTAMLRSPTGLGGRDLTFGPEAMSDGTIRAAGVLAALFQPGTLDGRIPLVGIEEPEVALHPAAAGVLFDALTEVSERVQVVATSQSPDLLDRDELDMSSVRAVSMERGLTVIGDVDEASQRIVKDRLYTLGELMRGNQITPKPTVNGDRALPQARPWHR